MADNESEASSEFDINERDFITLGYAKVPLISLLTNSTGFSGEVKIMDDFNQYLGSIDLNLSLNHQSRIREPNTFEADKLTSPIIQNTLLDWTLIQQQREKEFILSINFLEFVSRRWLPFYLG